jgi:NDP-sugar pyrophosphorylase family protein
MVPIMGQPFMAWIMADMLAAGVESFIVVLRPDDDACQTYFSQDDRFRGRVSFAFQSEARGAGDALRQAAPLVRGDVVISACDNLVAADALAAYLRRWHERDGALGLLALMPQRRELLSRSGVVVWDGEKVTEIVEKPPLDEAPSDTISLPLYCLAPEFLAELADMPLSPRGEFEIQEPIRRLMARPAGVYGHLFDARYTLTAPEDLLTIGEYLLARAGQLNFVAPTAQVGAGAVLARHVILEAESRVGSGAFLQNVVVLPGGVVPPGAHLENKVIY